jgi:hypothetical protein
VVLTSTQTAPAPVPTEKFAGALVEQAVLAATVVFPGVVTLEKVTVVGGAPGLGGTLAVTFVPAGVLAIPVPVRPIVCVLPATPLLLSVIVTKPVRVPTAVGVKATSIVQVSPGSSGPPEPVTREQEVAVESRAKSPLAVMLVMVSEVVPLLVKVTLCLALVVLTAWFAKVRLLEERVPPISGTVVTVTVSATVMVSLSVGTVTVADGAGGAGVVVPVPLSERDWVKLDPAGVLVRLLKTALSVKVMVAVGVGEPCDGAV